MGIEPIFSAWRAGHLAKSGTRYILKLYSKQQEENRTPTHAGKTQHCHYATRFTSNDLRQQLQRKRGNNYYSQLTLTVILWMLLAGSRTHHPLYHRLVQYNKYRPKVQSPLCTVTNSGTHPWFRSKYKHLIKMLPPHSVWRAINTLGWERSNSLMLEHQCNPIYYKSEQIDFRGLFAWYDLGKDMQGKPVMFWYVLQHWYKYVLSISAHKQPWQYHCLE